MRIGQDVSALSLLPEARASAWQIGGNNRHGIDVGASFGPRTLVIRVTKPTPDYLRLVDPAADTASIGADDSVLLVRLCEAFEQATGWQLLYEPGPDRSQNPNLVWSAPVDPGVGASLGLIRTGFVPAAPTIRAATKLEDAVALAETVTQLWAEIVALREGVQSREAELTADVPVVARREAPERPPSDSRQFSKPAPKRSAVRLPLSICSMPPPPV